MNKKIPEAQTAAAGVWAFIASRMLHLQPSVTLAGVGMGLRVVVVTGCRLAVSVAVITIFVVLSFLFSLSLLMPFHHRLVVVCACHCCGAPLCSGGCQSLLDHPVVDPWHWSLLSLSSN